MSRDRKKLEELVFYLLTLPEPPISIEYGREILGFNIYEMRGWYKNKIKENEVIV